MAFVCCFFPGAWASLQTCSDREQEWASVIAQEYIQSQNRLDSIDHLIQSGHLSIARVELQDFFSRKLSSVQNNDLNPNCVSLTQWIQEHQLRRDQLDATAIQLKQKLEQAQELSLCQVMFEKAREEYEKVVQRFEQNITAQDFHLITQAIKTNKETLDRGHCPQRETKRLEKMAENLWKVLPQYSARAPAEQKN